MDWLTYGYVILVIVLVVVFLLKRYVQRWLGVFAHVLFFVSLLGAIVGLVSIRPFVYLADRSLQRAGTLETMRSVDDALPIDKVITPVRDWWETIKDMWQGNQQVESSEKLTVVQRDGVGVLEGEVYPQLVVSVAKSYRLVTLVVSVLGLVLSIYLSYTVTQTGELERLRKRIEKLENRE